MHREGSLTFITEQEKKIILAIHQFLQDRIKQGVKISSSTTLMVVDIQRRVELSTTQIIIHLKRLESIGLINITRILRFEPGQIGKIHGKLLFNVRLKRLKFLLNSLKTPGVVMYRKGGFTICRLLDAVYSRGSLTNKLLNTLNSCHRADFKDFLDNEILNTFFEKNNERYTLSEKGLSAVAACNLLTNAIEEWIDEDLLTSSKSAEKCPEDETQQITLTTSIGSLVVESGGKYINSQTKASYLIMSKKDKSCIVANFANDGAYRQSIDTAIKALLLRSPLSDHDVDDVVCYRHAINSTREDRREYTKTVTKIMIAWAKENSLTVLSNVRTYFLALYTYRDTDYYAFGYPELNISKYEKNKNNPSLWGSIAEKAFNKDNRSWSAGEFSQIFVEEFKSGDERKERILDILRQLDEDKCVNIVNVKVILNRTFRETNDGDENE